jgi:SAM-dependent methyltransferase
MNFGAPRWQMKAWMFRALSTVPKGEELHYWMQRRITKRLPRSEAQLLSIDNMAGRLFQLYCGHQARPASAATFFEFGAGRDLAVPLGFSARGTGRYIALDIEPLAKIDLIAAASHFLVKRHGLCRPPVSDWKALTRDWGIDYRSPADARATELPAKSIDCALSIDTLEHIPTEIIRGILKELRRITRDDGVLIMKIDYGDHFASFDPSITPFHFLRYSDEEWVRFQSRFQYVNRLRHSEYKEMFADAGFAVVAEDVERRPVEDDVKQALADRFRHFDDADLFTQGAIIVARPCPAHAWANHSRDTR